MKNGKTKNSPRSDYLGWRVSLWAAQERPASDYPHNMEEAYELALKLAISAPDEMVDEVLRMASTLAYNLPRAKTDAIQSKVEKMSPDEIDADLCSLSSQ